jgi:hypothetical protein
MPPRTRRRSPYSSWALTAAAAATCGLFIVAAQRLTPEKRERAAPPVFVVASSQPAPAIKEPLQIQWQGATAPSYWDTNQLTLLDMWKYALDNAAYNEIDLYRFKWKEYLTANAKIFNKLPSIMPPDEKPSTVLKARLFLVKAAKKRLEYAKQKWIS